MERTPARHTSAADVLAFVSANRQRPPPSAPPPAKRATPDDSLASRSRVAYEPYSDQQRVALLEELEAYLTADPNSSSDINLESVRQMRELLSAMKTLYGKQATEIERMQSLMSSGGPFLTGGGGGDFVGGGGGVGGDFGAGGVEDGVGESDPTGMRGMAIGHAPDNAAASGGLAEPPQYQKEAGMGGGGEDGEEGEDRPASPVKNEPHTMSRKEAYTLYKTAEGEGLNQTLVAQKQRLKMNRGKKAAAAAEVNKAKDAIDRNRALLDQKKVEREQQAQEQNNAQEIIDEEEYGYIQALKEAKQQYKTAHAAMLTAGGAANEAASEVDNAREKLLSGFNTWYAESFNEPAGSTLDFIRPSTAPLPMSETKADVMDDDEAFEHLQMTRVMDTAPESLAYVRARKQVGGRGLGARTKRTK